DGGDHGRGGSFAVGAGHVDDGIRILGVAHRVQQPANTVQAGTNAEAQPLLDEAGRSRRPRHGPSLRVPPAGPARPPAVPQPPAAAPAPVPPRPRELSPQSLRWPAGGPRRPAPAPALPGACAAGPAPAPGPPDPRGAGIPARRPRP